MTSGGSINAFAKSATLQGGAAGIGGGNSSSFTLGAGGSAIGPITLTSGNVITVNGGSSNTYGAGAALGGGGAGGFPSLGGYLTGATTLTALSSIFVSGGSSTIEGRGAAIGGGGGTDDSGGLVVPPTLPIYAAAPSTPSINVGTGGNPTANGEEGTVNLYTFSSLSCFVIPANQTFTAFYEDPIGAFVGAIIATDPNNSPLYFALTSSNLYFDVNPGGIITMVASLTHAPSPQTLTVQICNDKGACETTTVTVDITHVPPATKTSLTAVWIVLGITAAIAVAALAVAIAAFVRSTPQVGAQPAPATTSTPKSAPAPKKSPTPTVEV